MVRGDLATAPSPDDTGPRTHLFARGAPAVDAGPTSLNAIGRTLTAATGSRKRYQLTYQQTPIDSSADHSRGPTIELRIPASVVHIPTVRTVAADLAGRQDFDLDGIHDFRMAVDEACAQLVALATTGAPLRCEFLVASGHIDVTARVNVPARVKIPTNTFGWQVLTTLTDVVEPIHDLDTPPGQTPEVGIRLRISRDRMLEA